MLRPLLAVLIALGIPCAINAQESQQGRKVALLVAVQDYQDSGLSNLKYCENDITVLAGVLKSQGYKPDDIIVLTDTVAAEKRKLSYSPTAAQIRKELKGLVEVLRPQDTFLIAFSGHGAHLKQLKDKGLYFCAKGTNLEKPETMVSLAEVYEQLEKHCKAGLKLMFVDACRNDPTDGKSGTDGRLESLTRPLVPDPPGGTVAFFSCSTGQKSYESDRLKHGIFFHHVIQGLKGGPIDDPIDRKGEVTLPLLEDYLTRTVPLAVKKDRDDRSLLQTPERKGTVRGQVVLARFDPNQGEVRKDYAEHLKSSIYFSFENEFIKQKAANRLTLWKQSAEMGNSEALYLLAICHWQGYGTPKNPAETYRCFRLAAESGFAPAQNRVGTCLDLGIGTDKNERDAVTWFHRAADQNLDQAIYNLALRYELGKGIDKDESKALSLIRRTVDLNYPPGLLRLAFYYQKGKCGLPVDMRESVKWLRMAAERDLVIAQYQMGRCLEEGIGVEIDATAAVSWYRKAADRKLPEAQYYLGHMYNRGFGVTKDEQEAFRYFLLAAEQKYAPAQFSVGYGYHFGIGVKQNDQETAKWYRLAADQNEPRAVNNLANCYELGRGIEKNMSEALKLYQKAADLGEPTAQNTVAGYLLDGKLLPENREKAIELLRKSAKGGNEKAKAKLKELNVSP